MKITTSPSRTLLQKRAQTVLFLFANLPRTILIGFVTLLAACASSHDMKDGGESFFGGGYLVTEESPGVFRVTAKTNVAQ